MANQAPVGKPIAYGRTAEIYAWEEGRVLKLYHDWVQRHWIEEEIRATQAVHAAGLPVPWCGDLIQIGDRFGVTFEKITGVTMLQVFSRQPPTVFRFMSLLARLHVQLHAVSVTGLPSQRDALIWDLNHAPFIDETQRAFLLARLERLPGGDRVCHHDFHPDNVMLTDRGPIIIDWMAAKQGNPIPDITRTCLLIDNGAPIDPNVPNRRLLTIGRRAAYRWYQREYKRLGNFDTDQFKLWIPIMAAARLNENIAKEKDWLLRVVSEGCKS